MQAAEGNLPNVAITCLLSLPLKKQYILSCLAFLFLSDVQAVHLDSLVF